MFLRQAVWWQSSRRLFSVDLADDLLEMDQKQGHVLYTEDKGIETADAVTRSEPATGARIRYFFSLLHPSCPSLLPCFSRALCFFSPVNVPRDDCTVYVH